MYIMKDIVRDGNEILRKISKKVEFPLNNEQKNTMNKMMEYLTVSQDEVLNDKYKLRPGVGLAAPQINVSGYFSSILIKKEDAEGPEQEQDQDQDQDQEQEYMFKGTIINPKIIRESVKKVALANGEGCLSVDNDIPGLVLRSNKITVQYQNEEGEFKVLKLEGYPAIVFQHEIDHLNGVLYYDHIDHINPWSKPENTKLLG